MSKSAIASIAVSAVVVASTPAISQSHETCDKLAKIAETIVEKRYAGVKMRTMMGALESQNAAIEALIQDAYALPNYQMEEAQNRAKREMSNEVYSLCLEKLDR